MSDEGLKALVAKMAAQIDELQRNQPKRVNGAVGFMAEKLKVNIGSVITVCSVIIAATWWMAGLLGDIREDLQSANYDRWTGTHMSVYSSHIEAANPSLSLHIPDARKIQQDYPAYRHAHQ